MWEYSDEDFSYTTFKLQEIPKLGEWAKPTAEWETKVD